MDRLFDLYKSTWRREKHLRLVGWPEDFVSRTLLMRVSDLWSSLPPTSRPPAKSAEFGRRSAPWLVGLALVLAPTAAKAEAPFHLRFEGAAIPGTDLRLELDGGLDGGLSVRRQKVRARVPVDLPYPEFLIGVSAKAMNCLLPSRTFCTLASAASMLSLTCVVERRRGLGSRLY